MLTLNKLIKCDGKKPEEMNQVQFVKGTAANHGSLRVAHQPCSPLFYSKVPLPHCRELEILHGTYSLCSLHQSSSSCYVEFLPAFSEGFMLSVRISRSQVPWSLLCRLQGGVLVVADVPHSALCLYASEKMLSVKHASPRNYRTSSLFT